MRGDTLVKLQALEGVNSIRLNPKAGSVTVCYDVGVTDPHRILAFIHADCLGSHPATPSRLKPKHEKPRGLANEIGRMALSVLVNKGVSYSLSSLLGARV